jgi:uncharacterized protein (TIGR03437 family)
MYVPCQTSLSDTHVSMWSYSLDPNGALAALPASPFQLSEAAMVDQGKIAFHPSGSFLYLGDDIRGYVVDGGTGALTEMPGSPFLTNITLNAAADIAITPSGDFLYAVFGHVQIGGVSVLGYRVNQSTGVLTPLPASPFSIPTPRLLAVDAAGRFLNVFSDSNTAVINGPGPRALLAYAIDPATGNLTQASETQIDPNMLPLALLPTPAGEFLYLAYFNNSGSSGILGFTQNVAGTLTPLPGSPYGVISNYYLTPAAIDPLTRFFYAQESNNANTAVYAINGATGALSPIPGATINNGLTPSAIENISVAAPQAYYQVTGTINGVGDSVSAWTLSATGSLTPVPGSPFATGLFPYAAILHAWPVYRLTLSAPANATAGVPFTVSVSAQDRFGNLVPGYSGTVHFGSSDANATLPPDSRFPGGSASLTISPRTAGSLTITVKDAFLANVLGASAVVQVSPGPTAQFAFQSANLSTAGIPLSFTATAQDQYSNRTPSYAGPVRFASSDASANLPSNNALTNGVGTFSVTFETDGPQSLTMMDAANPQVAGKLSETVNANVTILTTPPSLQVVLDGAPQITPYNWSVSPGVAHTISAVTPQPGPQGTQYAFTGWSDGGAATHSISLAGSFATYTASFAQITSAALANAASLTVSPGAPNAIFTAFGAFPGCAGNATASVDGQAATVYYSSPTQINFLLPSAVTGEPAASVQLSCSGVTTQPISPPIAEAAPALFIAASTQAAVVNQDGTVDTASPAGSVIQLYGTGFGPFDPAGADGLTRLTLPVTATIGGVAAEVLFAGQALGFTPGLQQIDVLVPANAPKGPAVSITLSAGGFNTQAGVTIGVR